jgi:hypothetical protein
MKFREGGVRERGRSEICFLRAGHPVLLCSEWGRRVGLRFWKSSILQSSAPWRRGDGWRGAVLEVPRSGRWRELCSQFWKDFRNEDVGGNPADSFDFLTFSFY